MSKQMMVEALAAATGLPNTTARIGVDALLELITTELRDRHEFRVTGFGGFFSKATAEREARNPRTGGMVTVPPGHRVTFRAGVPLKEALVVKLPEKPKRRKAA